MVDMYLYNAEFNAESKTGFRINVGPMVLMLCQIMCLFWNNFKYMMKLFEK